MILQSLVAFYEAMASQGEMPPVGYMKVPVSYMLCIDRKGNLVNVIHTTYTVDVGKKTVEKPVPRVCPAQVSRSSGVVPNFLCDHSGYLLGVSAKGTPKRNQECFAACRMLHHTILDSVNSEAAKAVLAFLDHWDPDAIKTHPVLKDFLDAVIAEVNLLFCFEGKPVSEDQAIREAWDRYYNEKSENQGYCLITGTYGTVERTHPLIRGVVGAQSSGAALVSFNAPAFSSYGKEQNLNAPIGKYATFAYTTALNYLIRDPDRHKRIGDITLLFWMDGQTSAAEELVSFAFFHTPSAKYTEDELWDKIQQLLQGVSVEFDGSRLDPDKPFYILGLSPNAARLSVRFFFCNTFGSLLRNILRHQERLAIVSDRDHHFESLPIWKQLDETVNQKSQDKAPDPHMAGDVLRSVLTDTPYPATMLNAVILRIRAERKITRCRAAMIKAYYLKNTHPEVPEEVLTMSLNSNSCYVPYCLGRLFAVLEKLQKDANGATTVKDHYFVSAAATPASIFAVLLRLSKSHIKKIHSDREWLAAYYDKQIRELMDKFGEALPARLTLAEQGSFQLGYYHQNVALYQKKEDQNNV
ncbi:MAG: type I-C CRISPR-associated protein Cas8c/Csd1 [Clostridia bacterium]|nr:type I-C CRISPR-associated protein Cas8c/Csd1 [Clostridia bacterium]